MNKLSGEYKLYVEGDEIIVLEAENVFLKVGGGVYGKCTLSLGDDLAEDIADGGDIKPYVETAKLIFTSEKDKRTVEFETKGKSVIKITASAKDQKFEKPTYPDDSKTIDALNEEELNKMLESFDGQKIIDILKEAGVPQELIDSIINGMGSDGDPELQPERLEYMGEL